MKKTFSLKRIAAVLSTSFIVITAGCGNAGGNMATQGPQAAEPITLDWQEMQNTLKAEEWAGLPPDAGLILEQHLEDFGGIQIVFFTLPGDGDYVYTAMESQGRYYKLGPAGTYNYRKQEDLTAAVPELFDGPALKITGGLGANLSQSSYYAIDQSGTPSGLLQVSTGHTREADVDGNGIPEVVSAHGTPMTAYVYRWHNGHAEEANLNDALQADSVMLRDDLVFEVSNLGEQTAREYRLLPEGLIPVLSPEQHEE